MKKTFYLLILCLLTVTAVSAQKSDVFSPGGKAIRGYDPVAFFTLSKPVPGVDSLTYAWDGTTWYFSTRQNLDSFKTHPEKYAPQYGGYCAYGAAMGHKAPTETDTWSVVEDKLYFNYNQKVKDLWTKDQSSLIKKADQQWPALKDKP